MVVFLIYNNTTLFFGVFGWVVAIHWKEKLLITIEDIFQISLSFVSWPRSWSTRVQRVGHGWNYHLGMAFLFFTFGHFQFTSCCKSFQYLNVNYGQDRAFNKLYIECNYITMDNKQVSLPSQMLCFIFLWWVNNVIKFKQSMSSF